MSNITPEVTKTRDRAFWAQVIVLGLVVGLGLQFAQAWTAPPAGGPTSGTITGPITTADVTQTKVGRLVLQKDFAVGTNATIGDVVSVQKTNGLCLGTSGCKKSWDEVSVPAGAVMAFNSDVCPAGWSEFNAARGRNIIGKSTVAPFNTRGGTGGQQNVTLTAAQSGVAAHSHLFDIMSEDGWTGQVFARNGNMRDNGGGTRITASTRNSAAQDAAQPHSVMDPYVVLLYCVKS